MILLVLSSSSGTRSGTVWAVRNPSVQPHARSVDACTSNRLACAATAATAADEESDGIMWRWNRYWSVIPKGSDESSLTLWQAVSTVWELTKGHRKWLFGGIAALVRPQYSIQTTFIDFSLRFMLPLRALGTGKSLGGDPPHLSGVTLLSPLTGHH
jgi:hypothetical protein